MTYVFSCPVYTLGIQLPTGFLPLHPSRVFTSGLLRLVFLGKISFVPWAAWHYLILQSGAEQAWDFTLRQLTHCPVLTINLRLDMDRATAPHAFGDGGAGNPTTSA
jgi:hypothetical protein